MERCTSVSSPVTYQNLLISDSFRRDEGKFAWMNASSTGILSALWHHSSDTGLKSFFRSWDVRRSAVTLQLHCRCFMGWAARAWNDVVSCRSKPGAVSMGVKPWCRLGGMRVRKIFVPLVSVASAPRTDRHFAGIARVRGEQPLTFVRRRCQLQFPEASWPAPSWSERRCGRYPPSHCLAYEPGAAWSSEAMPGVVSNVEMHMTGRRFAAGRSPRTCHAPDCSLTGTRCRATEPVILSSTRFRAAHGCACPHGLPVCTRS